MIMRRDYSRRAILRGVGAGMGAGMLPLLQAGQASAATMPKRMLLVMWSNGTIQDQFWPKGSASSGDLSSLTLPAVTAPLDEHKQDLLFIKGLTLMHARYGAHGNFPCTFTGDQATFDGSNPADTRHIPHGPSIDQVVADALLRRNNLLGRSLTLSILCGSGGHGPLTQCASIRDGGVPVAPQQSPAKAAAALFGPGATAGTLNPDFARLAAEKKSILDIAGHDLEVFAKNLGTDDRRTVQSHLDSVRDLERQIAKLEAGTKSCGTAPALPALSFKSDSFGAIVNAHADIITTAFRCDATRVGMLQLHSYNGDEIAVPMQAGIGYRIFHTIAHEPRDTGNPDLNNKNFKVKTDRYWVSLFASLIKKFKDTKEADGTSLLDNSVILFANHMSDGQSHQDNPLPWFLAGKCGGYFKTGRYLSVPKDTASTKLLVGMAQAMGVDLPNQTFGLAKYAGVLPGLSS